VVGGSGLYIKALLSGLDDLPPSDPDTRERYRQLQERDGIEGLKNALRKRRPNWMEKLPDAENPRRLIRALEMADAGMADLPETWKAGKHQPVVGLRMPAEQLAERIEKRVRHMYEQGILAEAEALKERYPQLSETAQQAIGYAEAFACVEGACSQDAAMERTVVRTRQLAKRQRTWFRHQLAVEWLDVPDEADIESIAEAVKALWDRQGPVALA
jgi:tRNA dimethylallyltransferase